jgi:hypothetical protein
MMPPGKLHKKPSDIAREKLAKRTRKAMIESGKKTGKLTDAEKKTPSQRKSESARAKEMRRAGVQKAIAMREIPSDCRGCTKDCRYGCDLSICPEKSIVHRCTQCGQKVRYRWIEGIPWILCPVCIQQGYIKKIPESAKETIPMDETGAL